MQTDGSKTFSFSIDELLCNVIGGVIRVGGLSAEACTGFLKKGPSCFGRLVGGCLLLLFVFLVRVFIIVGVLGDGGNFFLGEFGFLLSVSLES